MDDLDPVADILKMDREEALREIRRVYGVTDYIARDMLEFFHGGDIWIEGPDGSSRPWINRSIPGGDPDTA